MEKDEAEEKLDNGNEAEDETMMQTQGLNENEVEIEGPRNQIVETLSDQKADCVSCAMKVKRVGSSSEEKLYA